MYEKEEVYIAEILEKYAEMATLLLLIKQNECLFEEMERKLMMRNEKTIILTIVMVVALTEQ